MTAPDLSRITGFIWNFADDVLRDVYVRGKYRDVILPMTVLRRLDAVLEGTRQAVLDAGAALDRAGIVEQDAARRSAAGRDFYDVSRFSMRDLRGRATKQRPEADFRMWLDGFSPDVQDISTPRRRPDAENPRRPQPEVRRDRHGEVRRMDGLPALSKSPLREGRGAAPGN